MRASEELLVVQVEPCHDSGHDRQQNLGKQTPQDLKTAIEYQMQQEHLLIEKLGRIQ